ncbi:MAG TPA: DUF2723 domain-containing protein [Lutibacter sp.]|nr:DUF2723 domain-containing protein [Lutibacter sp.]
MAFDFNKFNKILGWFTFVIALVTYTLTLEPTVSFWDAGEYIATSANLAVGHPPGAPLFQMLGAFFAMFATDVTHIAKMVNFMSALSSAFTILFLFWTIVIITKKLVVKKGEELTQAKGYAILGSAFVGALAFTFSDSFWFSAVEAEVYAMSMLLTSLLFWLGLRWEEEMDQAHGNRWLLLISLVVGLSFGVHILSLLVIPPIVFLYIYKKYPTLSAKQFIIANIVSVLFLLFTFKFLFPFTLKYFSAMELFFVNNAGLPFNSGSIIAALLMIGVFYFAIQYTRKKKLVGLNTIVLSILFIVIGFSSWLMLPIRANANTTINENNPSSARELLAYYNREQYGDANVFYDKYYSYAFRKEEDKNKPYKDDIKKYEKDHKKGEYIVVNKNSYKNYFPNYSDKHKGFIPRMVATSPTNIKHYKALAGIPENSTRRPTFLENMKFMFSYQFGYMYGRYFMWNFVGRQNDEQGHLDIHNGNWLSGIPFIDSAFLGPQTDLPAEITNNKARNTYFFLPLILGLIGLFFHLKRDPNYFYILLLFFAFTGLAIIFYTNPKPFEPRERDYAVVGSFYVFAIWIGIGVLAIFNALKDLINPKTAAVGVSLVALLAVPVVMGFQNWDDHDRSNKYTAHLNAQAYLDSCDENAILFTIGDNDTFPLWYLQEIEGYRTDIKAVNTSLFATDWYIDQMKRKTYKADPIPSQLTHEDYKYGSLDVAYNMGEMEQFKDSVMDIKLFMQWIQSKKEFTYYRFDEDHREKTYPTNRLRLSVDKEAVLRNGIVAPEDAELILPYIDFEIDPDGITKQRILMLDILANFNWEQPIYFTGGSYDNAEFIWLQDYLQMDGLSYKLVPIKTPYKGPFEMGRINPDVMYKHVEKWNWGSITEDIYLDVETRKNSVNFRNGLLRLSDAFAEKGDTIKAIEILDLSLEKMPAGKFSSQGMLMDYVAAYYILGENQKARTLAENIITMNQEMLVYFSRFDDSFFPSYYNELENNLLMYGELVRSISKYEDKTYSDAAQDTYIEHLDLFQHLIDDSE